MSREGNVYDIIEMLDRERLDNLSCTCIFRYLKPVYSSTTIVKLESENDRMYVFPSRANRSSWFRVITLGVKYSIDDTGYKKIIYYKHTTNELILYEKDSEIIVPPL